MQKIRLPMLCLCFMFTQVFADDHDDEDYRDVGFDLMEGVSLGEVAERAHANAGDYWEFLHEHPRDDHDHEDDQGYEHPGEDEDLSAYEAVDEIFTQANKLASNPNVDPKARDIVNVTISVIDAWPQCEDTFGAVQRAIELVPDRAAEVVAKVAIKRDCNCSNAGLWPEQRVEERIRVDGRHALLDVPTACSCSQAAMLAGISGLPENSRFAEAESDEERERIIAGMSERVQEMIDRTVAQQSKNDWSCGCVDVNIAATIAGIEEEDLQDGVYDRLVEKYAEEAADTGLVVDSFGIVGWYPAVAWGKENYISRENILRRDGEVYRGDSLILDPFSPASEFSGQPDNRDFSSLGNHQITATEIPTDIFISEYIEGWNENALQQPEDERDLDDRNRVVELFNGSEEVIDLGQGQYFLEIYGEPGEAVPASLPPAVGEKVSLVKNRITLDSVTTFKLDSYELTPAAMASLDEVVAQLQGVDLASEVLVAGHTCSLASLDYNYELSENRARSVRNYLASKGIEPQLLRIEGRGETQPAFSNATEVTRRKNRRVEIDFVTQEEVRERVITWASEAIEFPSDEVGYGDGTREPRQVIGLNGAIEPGETFIVAHSNSDDAIRENANLVTGQLDFKPYETLVVRRLGGEMALMCRASGYAFVSRYPNRPILPIPRPGPRPIPVPRGPMASPN